MSINTLYTSVQATTIDELGARVEQFLLDHPEYAINGAPFVAENGTDYIQTFCLRAALSPIDFPKLCTKVTGKYIGNRVIEEGKPVYYEGDSVDPWDFEGWITLKDDPDQTTSLHYILRDEWYVSPRIITEEFFEKPAEQQVIKLFYKWATDKSGDIPIKPKRVRMTSISVHDPLKKSKYFEHEAFEKDGLSINVHYNNGSAKVVYNSCIGDDTSFNGFRIIPPDMETAGNPKYAVVKYTEHYSEGDITCECQVPIAVVVDWDSQIIITNLPDKLYYRTSDSVDLTGLEIDVIKDSKKRYHVAYNDYPTSFSCTGDLENVGDVTVDLAYLDAHTEHGTPLHATFKVHVVGKGRLGTPGIDLIGNYLAIYAGADVDPNRKTRNTETYTIYADDVAVATIDSEGHIVEKLDDSNDSFTKDISRIDLTTAVCISSANSFKVSIPSGWEPVSTNSDPGLEDPGIYYGKYNTDTKLISWELVTGDVVSASVYGSHMVWLRGVSVSKINHGSTQEPLRAGIVISSTTTGIKYQITGNLEALLDFYTVRKGAHPYMAPAAFEMLFNGNTGIVSIPTIDTVHVVKDAYNSAFNGCTSLTSVDFVPAAEIEKNGFTHAFSGCTSLKNVAVFETEDTVLGESACSGMFEGCTALVDPPKLPSMYLAKECYKGMFSGCTSITDLSEYLLPAILLTESCYEEMFKNCISIGDVPAKNTAAIPASKSYKHMLYMDDSHQTGRSLYISTVKGTSSAQTTDHDKLFRVGATPGITDAYEEMFKGCVISAASPEPFKTNGTPVPGTDYWLSVGNPYVCFTSSIASFTISCKAKSWDGILEYSTDKYYWNEWDGSLITAGLVGTEYKVYLRGLGVTRLSVDGGNLNVNGYVIGLSGTIAALLDYKKQKRNEEIIIQPGALKYAFKNCSSITHISDNFMNATHIKLSDGCFEGMFAGTGITSVPLLPWTELSDRCYSGMFEGCPNIYQYAENFALPAADLAPGCYQKMFKGCRLLNSPVRLPGVKLAPACYSEMYASCPALESLPVLGSDKFPAFCYERMFENCAKITLSDTQSPDLHERYRIPYELESTGIPGTHAVYSMFSRCELLNVPSTPALNTDYWTGSVGPVPPVPPVDTGFCIKNGGTDDATVKFGDGVTQGSIIVKYRKGTTDAWSNYAFGESISVTHNTSCYFIGYGWSGEEKNPKFSITGSNVTLSGNIMSLVDGLLPGETIPTKKQFFELFKGCEAITSISALTLPATALTESCYEGIFEGCTNLTVGTSVALPALPAKTTHVSCYKNMFKDCKALTDLSGFTLPANNAADTCYADMFEGCTALTKAPVLSATELAQGCYYKMFSGCTSLISAPALPAERLAESCYDNMFFGCSSLAAAPELPATRLAKRCYIQMFQGCKSLTEAPTLNAHYGMGESSYFRMFCNCINLTTPPERLPAETLATSCYQEMFAGCTSLATVPELEAETLAVRCYDMMFYSCTSLTTIPAKPALLPVESLADYCYAGMFAYCTSLITAPALPAKRLASNCYASMFQGCSSLAATPALPATTLAEKCYFNMFLGCAKLTTVSTLPAKTMASRCYENMFYECTSLTTAPALEATTLADSCYSWMFYGCTSLTALPALPALALAEKCYQWMFKKCSKIKLSTTQTGEYQTAYRIPTTGDGVQATDWNTEMFEETGGTFTGNPGINTIYYTSNNVVLNDYLCFTANSANSAVELREMNHSYDIELFYSVNNCAGWDEVKVGERITLANVGDKVYFRGRNDRFSLGELGYYYFSLSGSIAASGRVMSLIMNEGWTYKSEIPDMYCFYNLFWNCTNLTTAPELTAGTLKMGCYEGMFKGCTGLTTAPALSAMTLDTDCYKGMFEGCTSLASLPALPAITLKKQCYMDMFKVCSGIKLSATRVPSRYEIAYRIPSTSKATEGEASLNNMFSETGGTFTDTPVLTDGSWTGYLYGIAPKCATPVISQAAGSNDVTMTCSTEGATIHYTDDGSTPTAESATYASTITITSTKTFKAIAVKSGYDNSEVTTKECPYTPPTPTTKPYLEIESTDETKTFRLRMGSYNSEEGEWLEYNLAGMWNGELEYSTNDGATWITWSKGHEHVQGEQELVAAATIPDTATNKLRIRAKSGSSNKIITDLCHYSDADSTTSHFRLVATEGVTVNLSGNLMTLLNSGNPPTVLTEENARAFYSLFCGMPVVDAHDLNLTATTLAEECYGWMFDGCTSLTAAPTLPATTLAETCYCGMFSGCTSLTTAPTLSVTTLFKACYSSMFSYCSSLATAPALPATAMAESCYANMLEGTAITAAPDLSHVTTLADYCFDNMFCDCTSLTAAPTLNAEQQEVGGPYYCMFYGTDVLPDTHKLDFNTNGSGMFQGLFAGTKITDDQLATILPIVEGKPTLSATTLAENCYQYMFLECTSLTTAPALPATALTPGCYTGMFAGCTSLTALPVLPATTLPEVGELERGCYSEMFADCTGFSLHQTEVTGSTPYRIPSDGACTVGELSCAEMFARCEYEGETSWITDDGTPQFTEGVWTGYLAGPTPTVEPVCFTANTAGSTVELQVVGTPTGLGTFEYSTDKTNWNTYTPGTTGAIILANAGDKVYFKGNAAWSCSTPGDMVHFRTTGSVDVSGDIVSLIGSGEMNASQFSGLFAVGPETFESNIRNASGLTLSPAALVNGCYAGMFSSCTSLQTAPTLPATTLAAQCYQSMFFGCTSLTSAPALPATTLASECYNSMFQNCTSLTTPPALPATILADDCYNSIFMGCSNIKVSETQTGEYPTEYRVPTTGTITETPTGSYGGGAFDGTGGTYTGDIIINPETGVWIGYLASPAPGVLPTGYFMTEPESLGGLYISGFGLHITSDTEVDIFMATQGWIQKELSGTITVTSATSQGFGLHLVLGSEEIDVTGTIEGDNINIADWPGLAMNTSKRNYASTPAVTWNSGVATITWENPPASSTLGYQKDDPTSTDFRIYEEPVEDVETFIRPMGFIEESAGHYVICTPVYMSFKPS